jgi:hypothetical protein
MATLTFSHPCPKQKLKREVCGNYLKKTNQCGSIHRQPGFRIQRGCFVLKGAPYLLPPSALPPAITTSFKWDYTQEVPPSEKLVRLSATGPGTSVEWTWWPSVDFKCCLSPGPGQQSPRSKCQLRHWNVCILWAFKYQKVSPHQRRTTQEGLDARAGCVSCRISTV